MKILQFCYKPPLPASDGGALGMHSLTLGLLNNGNQVKVIAFNSYKHPCNKELLPKSYVEATGFETIFVDLKLHIIDALVCLLKNESYHVKRFVNENMEQRLISLLKEETFDVVQLESILLAPYIPIIRKYSKAKLILRAPNIEHIVWFRLAKNTKNPFKKLYLLQLAHSLKKFELRNINFFDGVFPVTQIDADFFIENGCKCFCKGVAVGMEMPDFIEQDNVEENTLFHIGSMDWLPNQQGIKFFIDNIWDSLHQKLPFVKAYFAGRAMPLWMINLNKEGIVICGEVPDSTAFICSKEIMIVPLLSGSGIRIKILEAMSLGKCVIATSLAVEGIMCEDEKNVLIANTKEEFIDRIIRCVKDRQFSKMIGQNAENLIKEKYNINAIAKQLTDLYIKL
ncbi:MAG: glycosyltransferase family 4 protein [Bacteroidales bacterium]|jgi:glycosyltransferase involved in cell wall biosynthesis|nr:glycosyltransferase family 4 protein [Bacteroidales bacterium]